jgi:hypothetical protein
VPAGIPRRLMIALAALCALGVAAWAAWGLLVDGPRAGRALLISFAYLTPMCAGMVVWSAVVLLARGRWMGELERYALAGAGHVPVGALALAGLAATAPAWAPWMHHHPHQGAWLSWGAVFARDGAAMLVLWAMMVVYFFRRQAPGAPLRLGGALVLVYCVAISLVAFDLVMSLDPHWYSTLFGGYMFISGMYMAVAAWTLLAVVLRPDISRNRMADLGKLLVAFSLLTTYMMYSQLLPIWYENLPHEVRFVLPRLNVSQWPIVSVALLATIYLGPLVLLLARWVKRTRATLGAVAALVLAGMWVERWWLIAPTPAEGPGAVPAMLLGVPELALAAGLTAGSLLLILAAERRLRLAPLAPEATHG